MLFNTVVINFSNFNFFQNFAHNAIGPLWAPIQVPGKYLLNFSLTHGFPPDSKPGKTWRILLFRYHLFYLSVHKRMKYATFRYDTVQVENGPILMPLCRDNIVQVVLQRSNFSLTEYNANEKVLCLSSYLHHYDLYITFLSCSKPSSTFIEACSTL